MRRTHGFVGSIVLGAVQGFGRSLPALGSAAALLVLAGHAAADIKAVEPYFVVVTKDNVPLKCSDGNIYYAVAKLKANQVLRIDGTGGGWLRAEYPAGTRAYVKADEGMFDEAAKTLKLTRPSKLMSANTDPARPWWYLLDADVPAGTVFNNAQAVKSADGTLEGYLIPAPAASRGYIREEATRAATAEEAKAFMMPAAGTETAIKPVTPAPAAPAAVETAAATTPTPPTPAPSTTAAATPTALTTPPAPATAPSDTPSTITMSQNPVPGATTPAAAPTSTPVAPTATTMAPSVAPVTPAPTKRVEDMETLRNMFDRVMQGPGDETEIRTVISEFNRTIANLGNTDRDTYTRNALQSRLQALQLRQEVLDMRQHITETDRQFTEKTKQTTIAIQEVEKQAIYTIVGRIVPSTVYDGRRGLPMMYRVESADASSTRTIGYVVPREGVDLLPKMGKVVGIVGESKMDPALGLNIVAPRRVDSLEIVGGKFQVVKETQTTSTSTTTGPNGTLTTTTTVTTSGPGGSGEPQPAQPVPVAQPNEQPDVNK